MVVKDQALIPPEPLHHVTIIQLLASWHALSRSSTMMSTDAVHDSLLMVHSNHVCILYHFRYAELFNKTTKRIKTLKKLIDYNFKQLPASICK